MKIEYRVCWNEPLIRHWNGRHRKGWAMLALHKTRELLSDNEQCDKCVSAQSGSARCRIEIYESPRLFPLNIPIYYEPSRSCCGRQIRD